MTPISQTEHDYGSSIYESELDAASDLILKLVGTQVRTGDLLATSETVRDAFLIFLSPQRTQQALRVSGLQAAAGRIEDYLNRSLAELPSSTNREMRRCGATSGLCSTIAEPTVTVKGLGM